jgi:tetratricopeptide (TPR) repeat protein
VLGKAIDLHSRGVAEEALGYYEEALSGGVERTEVVFSVGLLKKELSHFDEAARYLQKVMEVPEYGLASRLVLGQCYWAQGRAEEALGHFIEALRIIDLDGAGPERADAIHRGYESMSVSRWGRGEGRGSELVVHSLMALLQGDDWRDKIREARHKLASLAGDGIAPILPEVADVPGGEEVVDTMISSRQHLKRGMPFTALEECYRAILLAPTYLPLHLGLAEIFAKQGKSQEAVDKYTVVADAYLMRDEPRKAMEVYQRALLAAPMSISIRERLIDLLVAHDELESALNEYVALGENYYRLARVDAALQKYEAALDLAKQTGAPADWEVVILHRVADLHMQRVQWKEAAAVYERILKVSPDDEKARFHLIELHYALGQEDRALRDVDALITRYGEQNEFSKIATLLKELVASNPQDISIRSRLSRFYAEVGMKKEAIAELDTLGELQLEAGRRRDAMETLRTIIALEPDQKEGYTQLLQELEDSGRTA